MTIDTLTSSLDPAVAPYVALALIVFWLTRRAYRESTQDRGQLLDRYESRFSQLESTLSEVTHDLAGKNALLEEKNKELEKLRGELAELRDKVSAAQAAEDRCSKRLADAEAKSEKRIRELEGKIAELEAEIEQLRQQSKASE